MTTNPTRHISGGDPLLTNHTNHTGEGDALSADDALVFNVSLLKLSAPTPHLLLSPAHLTELFTGVSERFLPLGASTSPFPMLTYSTEALRTQFICETHVSVDVSRVPYPRAPPEMPMWEMVLKCTVVAVLLLIAVFGNLLIICIVWLSKKMKTTTNYYIVNLAVADLLVAVFPMWIYVITDVTPGWILGGFLCKFNAFVQTTAMCAVSFTMMAIAGDRFFAIVFPLKARVTHRKVKVVILVVWVCAISIGVPPTLVYTYQERQWANYRESFCHDIWPVRTLSDGTCDQGVVAERIYWSVVISVLNWIPMAMMTVNYTVIIHHLQCSRVAHSGSMNMSAVQRRSARKVVKMLFTLLVTFMVCSLPFQVTTMYEIYKERKTKLASWYQPVYFTSVTLMVAHSSINPILYGAMNQTFQNGFRQLLDRIRCHHKKAWESQLNIADSLKPCVSIVNNGQLDLTISTAVTELFHTSSKLGTVVVGRK